jgi:hypothetical protein
MAKQQQHETARKKGGAKRQPCVMYHWIDRDMTAMQFVQMFRGLTKSATVCPHWSDFTALFGRENYFRTYAQIAEAFEVNASTVRGEWASAGLPGNADDGWPIGEVFHWWLGREIRKNNR